MKYHEDSSITEIPVIKAPTMPKNIKQLDSLLNTTEMSKEEVKALGKIIDRHVQPE